jgi:hypothetical protein
MGISTNMVCVCVFFFKKEKRKKKKKKVSDSLATTCITKAIPKDHVASQHDTYAAYHAHLAKDTYAITTNHAIESSATNAGIITEMPHPADSKKKKKIYSHIFQCVLPTTTRKGNYHHSFNTEKARPTAPVKERSLLTSRNRELEKGQLKTSWFNFLQPSCSCKLAIFSLDLKLH